jgi:hypothetical protein
MEISLYEESGGLFRRMGASIKLSGDLSIQLSSLMREERQQATRRSLKSLDLRHACGAPTRILAGNSS